jgi:iron(III) transport system ATP-binding protein
MSDGAFLSVRGLTKRFGRVDAVAGASFEVDHASVFTLVGPSGCGKTTLLRLIAGFERPDRGGVSVAGRIVSSKNTFIPPEKRRVGIVFQDYALFPHLTVEGNVAFGVKGVDRKKRVAELLDTVGLSGLGSRMPHELSGGQQQRVALARSMAAKPELILLDEPFSNLDPSVRAQVREELRDILHQMQMTAVFVTHDQEEALALGDRVGVMIAGEVVQAGTPEEVYKRPASRAIAHFLGDANFLPGRTSGREVECELGRFGSAETSGSTDVEVMIRPEELELTAEAGVPVSVVNRQYFGHDQLVTVRLPSGQELQVRTLSAHVFSTGDSLGLRATGNAVTFPVR